jgi:hypothetical protein
MNSILISLVRPGAALGRFHQSRASDLSAAVAAAKEAHCRAVPSIMTGISDFADDYDRIIHFQLDKHSTSP